jgi:hypothetical protein
LRNTNQHWNGEGENEKYDISACTTYQVLKKHLIVFIHILILEKMSTENAVCSAQIEAMTTGSTEHFMGVESTK